MKTILCPLVFMVLCGMLSKAFAQGAKSQSIQNVLAKEQQAILNRDFAEWQSFWINDKPVYYLKAIDGLEFNDFKSLQNHFQDWMGKSSPSTSILEQGDFQMEFNPDSSEVFVSFDQNLISPNTIFYPDSNNRTFEIRSLKKFGNQWKIKRAISIHHYHESSLSQAEIFLNRAAFILMEKGKLDEAIAVGKSIVEAFPNSGAGYATLISFYIQKEDLSAVRELAIRALEHFPEEAAFQKLLEIEKK